MEITFSCLRSKELVNVYDGKRLGHITDLVFDKESGRVLGLIVPEPKKMFKKAEDIFIPLDMLKKIGDDVILVRLEPIEPPHNMAKNDKDKQKTSKNAYQYKVDCGCEERKEWSHSHKVCDNEHDFKREQSYSKERNEPNQKIYARYKRVPQKLQ